MKCRFACRPQKSSRYTTATRSYPSSSASCASASVSAASERIVRNTNPSSSRKLIAGDVEVGETNGICACGAIVSPTIARL